MLTNEPRGEIFVHPDGVSTANINLAPFAVEGSTITLRPESETLNATLSLEGSTVHIVADDPTTMAVASIVATISGGDKPQTYTNTFTLMPKPTNVVTAQIPSGSQPTLVNLKDFFTKVGLPNTDENGRIVGRAVTWQITPDGWLTVTPNDPEYVSTPESGLERVIVIGETPQGNPEALIVAVSVVAA